MRRECRAGQGTGCRCFENVRDQARTRIVFHCDGPSQKNANETKCNACDLCCWHFAIHIYTLVLLPRSQKKGSDVLLKGIKMTVARETGIHFGKFSFGRNLTLRGVFSLSRVKVVFGVNVVFHRKVRLIIYDDGCCQSRSFIRWRTMLRSEGRSNERLSFWHFGFTWPLPHFSWSSFFFGDKLFYEKTWRCGFGWLQSSAPVFELTPRLNPRLSWRDSFAFF